MIAVHRLNKSEYFLNADLIQYLESIPDTVITLRNGEKLVVLETIDEVCEKIIAYKRLINHGFNDVAGEVAGNEK